MVFNIGNLKWSLFCVDSEDEKLVNNGTRCMGITYFSALQIYMNNSLPKDLFRQVFIHELVHAFIFTRGAHLPTEDSDEAEEFFCDFMGANLDEIHGITDKIMAKKFGR